MRAKYIHLQEGFAPFQLKVAPLNTYWVFLKLRSVEPLGGTTDLFSEKRFLGDEVLSKKVRSSVQESGGCAGGREGFGGSEPREECWCRSTAVRGDTGRVCACLHVAGDMPRMHLVSEMTFKTLYLCRVL